MPTERPYHFHNLLQVSKESLSTLIAYIFFYVFPHVYSPRTGVTTPWGQNFDVNRKALSLCPFSVSFKNISLNSDFIHIF